MSDETIYAVSSGQVRAGVSVIRVSGGRAAELVRFMCGADLPARVASFKSICHPVTNVVLDRGLVLWFPGPHSFTGEDVVEFHVHGGKAVVSSMLLACGSLPDMRMAEAGEFTRRAFYNGKLDLTEIEAIADLIDAETEFQRQQAVRQLGGGLSEVLDGWRERLIRILAYVEAGIDFSDEEDIPDDVAAKTLENITFLRGDIISHLDDNRSGERLREGLQVVIAGPPNAGKSSLLNRLARRDVAIVSEQAGTTRDIIEVHLDLNGFPVTICDTAGLREIEDIVEEEGVRRAKSKLALADVILWTTDATIEDVAFDFDIDSAQTLIRIRNKSDIDSEHFSSMDLPKSQVPGDVLHTSAVTGAGLDELVEKIAGIAEDYMGIGDGVLVTRARHREALGRVVISLSAIIDHAPQLDELIAEGLRVATRELARITGRVDVEDLLDVIFNDFCVGK